MAKEKILVVEDEEDIAELVRYNLAKEGFKVVCVGSGEEGLKAVRSDKPDLILLDVMLPGSDGVEICRILQQQPESACIPVIMVTAKSEDADVVTGLELGAADYITKPFSPRVLIARVRAALRKKTKAESEETVRIDALTVDPIRHEASLKGTPLDLTFTEFKVLHFLAKRPGRVFSRYQIVDAVRGENYHVTARSVDVQIAGLRKKLGDCASFIETVRGVGYRFADAR